MIDKQGRIIIDFFKNATLSQRIFIVCSVLWVIFTLIEFSDDYRFRFVNFLVSQIPLILFWGIYWIKSGEKLLQRTFIFISVLLVICFSLIALSRRRSDKLEMLIILHTPLILFWGIYWIKGAIISKKKDDEDKDGDKEKFSTEAQWLKGEITEPQVSKDFLTEKQESRVEQDKIIEKLLDGKNK